MINSEQLIDISVPVSVEIPYWPDTPQPSFLRRLNMDRGDINNDTTLQFSVHTGTHIDAPLHFLQNGKAVEHVALDPLIGPALVVDMTGRDRITAADLSSSSLPNDVKRILFKTDNSLLWAQGETEFYEPFVAPTADAAAFLVDLGIELVGIDYLSIQRYTDGPETHQILLKAEMVILEGLNLTDVEAGFYQLICLPLKLVGPEGAPARAVLFPID